MLYTILESKIMTLQDYEVPVYRFIEEVPVIQWTPYIGETVLVRTIIKGGMKTIETAYYEDKIKAVPRGNAYIIGNGPSRKDFDLKSLKESGQTYGCNALYRDFIPDFLFMVDAKISKEVVDNKVYEKCVCYAPALEVNRYPNTLSLIPRNPLWASGKAAAWTACMHGHKNLYLLGFEFQDRGPGQLNNIYQDTECYGPRNDNQFYNRWFEQLRFLIKMRPYCNFTLVHDNPPEQYNHLQDGIGQNNSQVITYAEFKSTVLNQEI